jgi:phosphoserine phosphatase
VSELVATLIAGSGAKLSPLLVRDLAEQSKKGGVTSVRTEWLAPDEAADIFGSGIKADDWRGHLQKIIGDKTVDIIIQPAAGRRKKFLAADMESTVIEQELLDELAAEVGVHDQVATITRRAMNGEIDFPTALRERIALLKGQPVSILEAAAKNITFTSGAAQLVATMRANDAQTWLITGGFSTFAALVARKLGFNKYFANELRIENGVIAGVTEPILDRNRKKLLLAQACTELRLMPADCAAIGDGSNDVPMLEACNKGGGLGIAFQAKPKVRAAVPNQINHADLSALLYVQGYRKEEFVG